jgi:hypothetical protein
VNSPARDSGRDSPRSNAHSTPGLLLGETTERTVWCGGRKGAVLSEEELPIGAASALAR